MAGQPHNHRVSLLSVGEIVRSGEAIDKMATTQINPCCRIHTVTVFGPLHNWPRPSRSWILGVRFPWN